MSAIQVTCPGCKIALRFATAPTPGSKFKCSNCKATITIGTPKPRKSALATMPAAPPQAGSSAIANRPAPPPMPMPPASLLPTAMTPTPPPMPALPAQPFAPNPYPRQGQGNRQPVRKAGTSTGLIVGLIGGGIAVVAGVVVTLILVLKPGKNTDQARADEPPAQTQANDDAPKPKGESKSFLPPFGKPDPKPEKKDDTKPISKPEQKPDPKPEQKPDSKPDPKSDPKPRGNGSLTADVLRKIKMATVYIRITEGNGQKASGSGFYESSSSMVLTNAHVVGMLKVESPPPKKIEVVLLSGEKGEVTVPGKIIAVDRTSDLCVLDVPVPDQLKATLVPLTVSPAKDLLETQEVFIAGFPLGEGLGKNITISKSSVSSMRKARDGMLDQIQVNGGMHPGNSGGPVVDGEGNVVGVAVAGIEGTTINFAIPGEFVQSVLRGRLASINTANEATKRDGKYVVGIRVSTLDPLKKVKKISIDYWTGPPLAKSVPASDTQPVLGPDCTPRKTVEVAYKPEAMSGEASMVLDEMPVKGKVLFIQPVFVGESGQPRWVNSLTHVLAAPVEAKPAMLANQFYQGKATVQLKSTAKYKRSFGSHDESFLGNIEARLGETIISVGTNGAKVQLNVEKFATGVSVNNKAPETSPAFKKAVSKDVGALVLEMQIDKGGNIIGKKNVLNRVPAESRSILDTLGDQIQSSFDMVTIPLPGGMTTPGTAWKARRTMPIDGLPLPSAQTAVMDMTYTYRGVRPKDGREVAVIDLRGNLLTGGKRDIDITLRGQTTGSAEVDPATGIVLYAKAVADCTISARITRTQSGSMKGTLETTLTREPPANLVVAAPVPGNEPPPPPPGKETVPGTLPPGWQEFTPRNKAYVAWFPSDGKLSESENSTVIPRVGQIRVYRAVFERKNGCFFATSQITLPPTVAKGPPKERQDLLRDQCLQEFNGKLLEEKQIHLGTMAGKEYLMSTPGGMLRFRLLGTGVLIYRQIVSGTKEQVESKDAAIFMDSFKRRESTVKPDDPKPGDPKPGDPPPANGDEAAAVAALEKMRARVNREGRQPGAPVIEVMFLSVPVPDEALVHLKALKSLQKLTLRGSLVTDAWLAGLKDLPGLKKLDLTQTKITDEGLKAVKVLTALEELNLIFAPITDAGLMELKGLKNLKDLRVQGTKVTLVGLGELQKALPGVKISH